jgi:hypothetical protein
MDDSEDIKILHVVKPHRSSFGMLKDPPTLSFDPENKIGFNVWKRKWESWLFMATSGKICVFVPFKITHLPT